MAGADPWAVLGLPPSATWEEVRAAHRRLAKELHPDVGVETDHRRMAEVNEAFAALSERHASQTPVASPTPADASPAAYGQAAQPQSPPPAGGPSPTIAVGDDPASFSIDLLPAEAYEALLIVTSFLGDPWVIDEPYELTALLDPPLACRCNLWLVPEAGGSIVTIDVHPVRTYPTPSPKSVRDALIVELLRLDGPPR